MFFKANFTAQQNTGKNVYLLKTPQKKKEFNSTVVSCECALTKMQPQIHVCLNCT